MANTEGNTYAANWKKSGAGYSAWLKRRPGEKVDGATEEELIEQLWEIALETYGDGEACINLVSLLPVPKAAASYFDPPWFKWSCNESFHNAGDPASLYRDGLCSFCRAGLGGRNENERVIDGRLKGDLGFVWGASPGADIVSDAFVKFFRPYLGASIMTAPCRSEKRSMKRMWELVLPRGIPFVAHRKGTHADGVICPRCRTARFGAFVHEPIQKGLGYAIERSKALRLRGDAAVAFAGLNHDILVNSVLAARLKKSMLKGVLLRRVAILPAAEVGSFRITKLTRRDVSG